MLNVFPLLLILPASLPVVELNPIKLCYFVL
jgi:hypothetical protein